VFETRSRDALADVSKEIVAIVTISRRGIEICRRRTRPMTWRTANPAVVPVFAVHHPVRHALAHRLGILIGRLALWAGPLA